MEFHYTADNCLKMDDNNSEPVEVYGVRDFSDWKQLSDAIGRNLFTIKISVKMTYVYAGDETMVIANVLTNSN